MTSRWVVEVAPRKEVRVRWRPFSLAIKNEGVEMPEPLRSEELVALGSLRVIEAVRAEQGDEPIGDLYTELGQRFHLEHVPSLSAVRAALEACGLDPAHMPAAEDESWDKVLKGSMAEAVGLVGAGVGVPILAFHDDDGVHAVSGPIMSPAPRGAEALELWDHVAALARCPNFFEMKRARSAEPQFSASPS